MSRIHKPPVVVITAGDPSGIGPEVIVKALARSRSGGGARPAGATLIVVGDRPVFSQTAKAARQSFPSWVRFLDLGHRDRFVPGRSTPAAGRASLRYLETAMSLMRSGQAQALVTGPLTKRSVEPWAKGFQGQTEWLAHACGASRVVMTFVAGRLRVALVTRHQGLRAVMRSMRPEELRETITVLAEGLRRSFGIARPRLAVCGVNPHAGEGGLFGEEEQRVMCPVLRALQRNGLRVEGPFAADGFFPGFVRRLQSAPSAAAPYDAVVCWYHDQGLIPFKLVARDSGCQVSLGLPIIRTAPDHGSALDIAGRGVADPGSMRAAIALAVELLQRRSRGSGHAVRG